MSDQFWPVPDCEQEFPAVDEVEVVFSPEPVGLDVFDFEGAVGRAPGWLDGGDVAAGYVGGGVEVGRVDLGGRVSLRGFEMCESTLEREGRQVLLGSRSIWTAEEDASEV